MDPRVVLGVIIDGLRSNFWGLACAAYCVQPSVGLLAFCLLLGWICGFCCALALVFRFGGFWTFAGPSSPSANPPQATSGQPSRAQVLASYLHEPGFRQPSRRS